MPPYDSDRRRKRRTPRAIAAAEYATAYSDDRPT
jgi:hypothetical protein